MRKLKLYFYNSDITVFASVTQDKYPSIADDMWDFIATPQKCYSHHTVSTGVTVIYGTRPCFFTK